MSHMGPLCRLPSMEKKTLAYVENTACFTTAAGFCPVKNLSLLGIANFPPRRRRPPDTPGYLDFARNGPRKCLGSREARRQISHWIWPASPESRDMRGTSWSGAGRLLPCVSVA